MAATATKKTMDFKQAYESVRSRAEEIKNDDQQTFPRAASPGDCIRQGDVYVTFEGESLKDKLFTIAKSADLKKIEKPSKQVVPGTTQGSQHVLSTLEGVTMYDRVNKDELCGPIMVIAEDHETVLTHPEHGDWLFGPGVYSISYQRAHADELRRQMD